MSVWLLDNSKRQHLVASLLKCTPALPPDSAYPCKGIPISCAVMPQSELEPRAREISASYRPWRQTCRESAGGSLHGSPNLRFPLI